MKKGERWVIDSRGTSNATVELMENVNPKEDGFFEAKIIKGKREYINRATAIAGDIVSFRTTLTRFKKQEVA